MNSRSLRSALSNDLTNITTQLASTIAVMQRRLREQKDVLDTLDSTLPLPGFVFRVSIESAWADDGEKGVVVEVIGSVKKAVETAEAKFKTINSRSDVQASSFKVEAALNAIASKFVWIPVRERFWEKFRSTRS